MKKILTFVCALMLGMGVSQAQVQQGETAVGANLVYGSEIESLGLGARFQYGILDQLRAEVGFNFFAGGVENNNRGKRGGGNNCIIERINARAN